MPPCDLHDLLVGDSQTRQHVLLVSASSCGSSGGNNNHRWISQGTRVQLVSRLMTLLMYTYIGAGNASKDVILHGLAGQFFFRIQFMAGFLICEVDEQRLLNNYFKKFNEVQQQ